MAGIKDLTFNYLVEVSCCILNGKLDCFLLQDKNQEVDFVLRYIS